MCSTIKIWLDSEIESKMVGHENRRKLLSFLTDHTHACQIVSQAKADIYCMIAVPHSIFFPTDIFTLAQGQIVGRRGRKGEGVLSPLPSPLSSAAFCLWPLDLSLGLQVVLQVQNIMSCKMKKQLGMCMTFNPGPFNT